MTNEPVRPSTARLAFLQDANESLRQYHETGVHRTQAEMDAWFNHEVQTGLDEANAGDLIPGEEVETEAVAWRALTRRRMEIGFHLELNDLLTQLDQWITDRVR